MEYAENKEHLGIYRYLLTSPNRDSRLFKEETAALKDIMRMLGEGARKTGRRAVILPGHGDYYEKEV